MSLAGGERITGIPFPLPPGEHIRWEGRPAWRPLARRAFHLRLVLGYFVVMAAWQVASRLEAGEPGAVVGGAAALMLVMGAAAGGVSLLLGWLAARTTTYAITDRRLVMKVGIVLSSTLNIPLRRVDAVSVRGFADGTGDLALQLTGDERIAYFQLWPHARPWRLTHTQPMLRSIPDAAGVGRVLRDALEGRPFAAPPVAADRQQPRGARRVAAAQPAAGVLT